MLAPLPAGAIRLGSTAFRFPKNYGAVHLTSDGRGFIAYDVITNAYWCYDLATGAPQQQLSENIRGWRLQWETFTANQQLLVYNESIPAPLEVRQWPSGTVVANGSVPCAMAKLSPDGRYVVEACVNAKLAQRQADQDMEDHFVHEVRVYDLANQKPLHVIKPVHNYCLHAHFSPTSEYLALTGDYANETNDDETDSRPYRETVQIVRLSDGEEVLRLRIPRMVMDAGVVFVPETDQFLTHEVTKQDLHVLCVRTIKTGNVVQKYELGDDGSSGPIRVSANGRYVVVCGNACKCFRIDLEDRVLLPVVAHPFAAIGFHPETYNSTWHIGDDGTVQFLSKLGEALVPWTAPHGPPSPASTGHLQEVTAITFSPDGQTIRTAGAMARVCAWDRSGKLVRTYELRDRHQEPLRAVTCFVNDTTTLSIDRHGITQCDLTTEAFQWVQRGEGELRGTPTLNTARTHLLHVLSAEDDDGEEQQALYAFDLANETERVLLELPNVQRAVASWCAEMLIVLTYNGADERTLCGYRIAAKKITEAWSQTAVVAEEADTDELGGYVRPERPSRFANRFTPMWEFDPVLVPHANAQTVLVVPTDGMRLPFVVNVITGEVLGTWLEPVRGPFAVHPTRDLVVVVDRRGDDVQLVNWLTGDVVQTILAGAYPTALVWSPDGTTLAVGLPDTTVVLVPVK